MNSPMMVASNEKYYIQLSRNWAGPTYYKSWGYQNGFPRPAPSNCVQHSYPLCVPKPGVGPTYASVDYITSHNTWKSGY